MLLIIGRISLNHHKATSWCAIIITHSDWFINMLINKFINKFIRYACWFHNHNRIMPINNYTCELWMISSIANDRVFSHSSALSCFLLYSIHSFLFIRAYFPFTKNHYHYYHYVVTISGACMHAYATCRLCRSRSFHSHRWFQCNAFLFACLLSIGFSFCLDVLICYSDEIM